MGSAVALRFFGLVDRRRLAARLHTLAGSNKERLRIDSPEAWECYGAPDAAFYSIATTWDLIGETYGAYLVMVDNVVHGVVTYSHAQVSTVYDWGRFKWQLACVEGPQLTFWLGNAAAMRPHNRYLLPQILQLMAVQLRRNAKAMRLTGRPWMLVRPTHQYLRRVLIEPIAGFGRFEIIDEIPDEFDCEGVVKGPFILYSCKYDVSNLRA